MYSERTPPGPLQARVECVWTSDVAPGSHCVRPDGCIDILYTRSGSGSRLDAVGTMTTAQYPSFDASAQLTGIRFRPGKALNLPAAELVDRSIALEDILPLGDFRHRLDDAPDPGVVVCAWLSTRLEPPTPVELALSLLEQDRNVDDIAAAANLSVRQFRRRCAELTGLSPRHLGRILRFRKACNLAHQSPRPDWAGIAFDAGYFDQAHLIRDFREFAGATPMAVFSNTASLVAL